ncbi:MAG: transposase, partial [Pseudomonadota bacterium]
MARKRYTTEEIIRKLRETDVLLGQGQAVADVIRQMGVTSVTCYRWRKEYGGLKVDQAQRLKD